MRVDPFGRGAGVRDWLMSNQLTFPLDRDARTVLAGLHLEGKRRGEFYVVPFPGRVGPLANLQQRCHHGRFPAWSGAAMASRFTSAMWRAALMAVDVQPQ